MKIYIMKCINYLVLILVCLANYVRGECKFTSHEGQEGTLVCMFPLLAQQSELSSQIRTEQSDSVTRLIVNCDKSVRKNSDVSTNLLVKFTSITDLTFNYCKFSELKDNTFLPVNDLRNLTIRSHNIDEDSLSLNTSPGAFSSLSLLESLDLSTNSIWEIPVGLFCGLSTLRTLLLSENHLHDLTQLGFMVENSNKDINNPTCTSDLTKLDLSRNDVEVVSGGALKGLSRLEELLIKNNKLGKVDDTAFEGLSSLHTLDLSGNKLVALPQDAFLPTPKLMYFRAANNSLSVLAPGLFRGLQHLVELDLSYNDLRSEWLTESSFQGLIRLMALDLSHNKIDSLNVQVLQDMYSVQVLVLSHNTLTEIPPNAFSSCVNLHRLDLSHNKIRVIGEKSFHGMNVLSFLALDNNNIVSIHSGAFTNLTSLHDLNINGNRLSAMPEAIASLRYLHTLDLGDNQITAIENMPVRGLEFLYGLRLVNNKISGNLSKDTFHNLPSLKVLNLAKNFITNIVYGAFRTNSKLQAIRLDGNRLTTMNNLFEHLPNLQWLNVSANTIGVFDYHYIPPSLLWLGLHNNRILDLSNSLGRHDLSLEILDVSFNRLKHISSVNIPDSVKMVFLNDNKINMVEPFTFFKKVNLTRVDLFSNNLSNLEITAFRLSPVSVDKKLPEFYLGQNSFVCNCEMEWLQRINSLEHTRTYPRIMDMDNVYCRMPFARAGEYLPLSIVRPSQFLCEYTTHCFPVCHCCEFDACDCEMTCPQGCGCFHEQSWRSNIVDCSMNEHLTVPDNIPMDASEVYLDGNDFRNLSSHSFLGRKHLLMLFVNGSNINTLDNGTFSGLSRLIALHLEDNHLVALRGHEFKGLDLLRQLYIHNNLLQYIHQHTFATLSHLEVLTLHNNQLINFPVWRLVDNPYLTSVSLSENLWTCESQFVDSFDIWLSGNLRKVSDGDKINCFPPDRDTGGHLILGYNSTTYTNSSISSTVVHTMTFDSMLHPLIAIGVAFVLVVSILVVVLCRKSLKVWLHSQFGLRVCQSSSTNDDKDKLYDAFISYSSKDEVWVNQVLAAELEHGERPYRTCLHYRDFPITAYTTESIIDAAESAQRVIIILSRNFIENEWCRFQFKSAHHEIVKKKRKNMIVIVLGEISLRDLDPDLRLYLKSETCIYSSDKQFWEKLRFAMPDASCNPQRVVHTYSTIPERALAHSKNIHAGNGGPSVLHHPSADGTYWA